MPNLYLGTGAGVGDNDTDERRSQSVQSERRPCQRGRFSFVAGPATRSLLLLRYSGDPEQKPPAAVAGYIETAGPSWMPVTA
jgi:hypothetical protein